jgi:hypothetical protein
MCDVGTDSGMASNVACRMGASGVFEHQIYYQGKDQTNAQAKSADFRRAGPEEHLADLLTLLGQHTLLGGHLPDSNIRTSYQYVVNATLRSGDAHITASFNRLEFHNGMLVSAHALTNSVKGFGRYFALHSDLRPSGVSRDGRLKPDHSTAADKGLVVWGKGWWDHQALKKGRETLESTPAAPESDTMTLTNLDDEAVEISFQYKARPLDGIWATAPFLHNGSVPNLDELLKPVAARVTKFQMGSREFDVQAVGYRTDLGDFTFDTTAQPGNSNAGHDYDGRALTNLTATDFPALSGLAKQLQSSTDPVSTYLRNQMPPEIRQALAQAAGPADHAATADAALVGYLNQVVGGRLIYEYSVFSGVTLRPKTKQLLTEIQNTKDQTTESPEPNAVWVLNRWLLEDAYPDQIVRSVFTPDERRQLVEYLKSL